jgi:hypothetical protein
LFSEADLVRFFHSLAETETLLKTAAHPRYQLEIGLVKLMEMRRLEPLNQLLQRLSALEESFRTGKPPAANTRGQATRSEPARSEATRATNAAVTKPLAEPAWSRSTTAAGGPAPAVTASPSLKTDESATAANVSPAWSAGAATQTALETGSAADVESSASAPASEIEQIKEALGRRRKMLLVTALEGARVARFEGNELCLEFAPDTRHLRDTLAKSDNVKILREVCREITDRDLGVRFVVSDGEAVDAPPSQEENERREKQSLREKAEQDPTVQQMLKTFRGEIADVKRVDRKS